MRENIKKGLVFCALGAGLLGYGHASLPSEKASEEYACPSTIEHRLLPDYQKAPDYGSDIMALKKDCISSESESSCWQTAYDWLTEDIYGGPCMGLNKGPRWAVISATLVFLFPAGYALYTRIKEGD